jgi:hypothetical protein
MKTRSLIETKTVWAFEHLLEEADAQWKAGETQKAAELTEKALGYYRGAFMGHEGEQPWSMGTRFLLKASELHTDISTASSRSFAHEIDDVVFLEVAVDKFEGLFGNAEVFRIGRVKPGPVAARIDHNEPLRRNAENIQNYSFLGKWKVRSPQICRLFTTCIVKFKIYLEVVICRSQGLATGLCC